MSPDTSSNLSNGVGSSEFDDIETFAYRSEFANQKFSNIIKEALSFPEWYRGEKAEYEFFKN